MTSDVRKIVLSILVKLDSGRYTLDRLLYDLPAHTPAYLKTPESKRDRSFLNALVYGVLRWRARLDRIIAHFSKLPVKKIDSQVLNILRMGLFQIIYMDSIPDSASVNTSVELAKNNNPPWVVGYVNAILRKAAREHQEVPFPDLNTHPVSAIATNHSFPEWLVRKWIGRLGLQKTLDVCRHINTIPPITIRVNSHKTNRAELINQLADEVAELVPTRFSPHGISITGPKQPIFKMKSFKKGLFQVQDEAAQLMVLMLAPKPGERILDACAGLGGKTAYLAQLMRDKGQVLALDNRAFKLVKLGEEMKRFDFSIVKTLNHDLYHPLNPDKLGTFDRILLDAPCSGLGVLRRNPDAKWTVTKNQLSQYHERQLVFLERLAALVRPGGHLAYAVCSPEPEETDSVIKRFLNGHPEFEIDLPRSGIKGIQKSLLTRPGYLRTFPPQDNMDGFFGTCLRKAGPQGASP